MGCSTRQYTYRLTKWGAYGAQAVRGVSPRVIRSVKRIRDTPATNSKHRLRVAIDPQVSALAVSAVPAAGDAAKGPRPSVCKDMDETAFSGSPETDSKVVDVEDEDADVGESDAPTPWPESWYEEGMGLGLQEFARKVMAECLDQSPEASDDTGISHHPMATYAAAESTQTDATGQRSSPNETNSGAGRTSQAAAAPSDHSNKRRISAWDGDDDGAEDHGNPKRRQGLEPPWNDATRGPFYACPYQKRHPLESPFCGLPHGSRRECGWDSVSRVK